MADKLPLSFSIRERVASAYNEAIGVKVRQGAPLASYAIDRKCLRDSRYIVLIVALEISVSSELC